MNATEALDRIGKKKTELNPMFTRMDADRDLAYGKSFTLKDSKGKAISKIMNVTLPEAKMFLSKCSARLANVQRQIVVESKTMGDNETTQIENWLNDLDYEADALLNAKGELDEHSSLSEFVNARGPIAEQVLLRTDKGQFVPDRRVLDTRYFYYDFDRKGLAWGAYETTRTGLDISSEFGISISKKTAVVVDFWDEKSEFVFVDGSLAKTIRNAYGYPPFVLRFPACGSSLKDKGNISRKGESIFYLLRDDNGNDLFTESNFVATILKTKNLGLVLPSYQRQSKEGEDAQPLQEFPGAVGSVTPIDPNTTGYSLMPEYDMRNYTRVFKEIIDTLKQLSTFTMLDFGTVTFPLSAVAMTKLTEGRNELLLPRLNAIASLRQGVAKMCKAQFRALGSKVELGEEGNKRSYSPKDLDGEYVFKFRYWTTSKDEMAADMAIANAAGSLVSEHYKRNEILKLENPDGEESLIDTEQLEREDEIVRLTDQMFSLIDKVPVDEINNLKAWRLLTKIKNLIKREKLAEAIPMTNPSKTQSPGANISGLPSVFPSSKSPVNSMVENQNTQPGEMQ